MPGFGSCSGGKLCEVTVMLNRYIKANRSDFLMFPLFMAVPFLLVEGFLAVLVGGFHEHSVPLMGGVIALTAGCIVLLIAAVGLVTSYFDIFLSFGRTRREALGMVARLAALYTAFCSLLGILFIELEKHLVPGLLARVGGFAEYRLESLCIPEGSVPPAGVLYTAPIPLPWWAVPLILAAAALTSFIIATVIRRWGSKAGWILYFIFLASILSFNYTDSLFMKLLPFLGIGFLVFLVGGFFWALRELRHTAIKI